MPQKRFGEFLVAQGLVSREQVLEAVAIQEVNVILIGSLAVQAKLLNHLQVHQVLERQKGTREAFGEAAAALGYGTMEQFDLLNVQQGDSIPLLGHTLVLLGHLDEAALTGAVRDFGG